MTGKLAYVTVLGRFPWASINTYYKILGEFEMKGVERLYVFTEERYREELGKVVKAFRILSSAYGMSPEVFTVVLPNYGFNEAEKKFHELFSELAGEGYAIGIDITSGRKAIVTAAIVQSMNFPVSFIAYMGLLD
ncbi:hypothetical protein, partial [Thermococcus sp.]|uniref:hypothetical protein n=1 Tax=Thermococcus sp. TaxID=35749 RepID=UPI002618D2FF